MERLWDTKEKMTDLLCELVSWDSVFLTQGEIDFPVKLQKKIAELDYFQQHPELLEFGEVNWGRQYLTALYKHSEAKDTLVLISHFDTVAIEDYGILQPLACKPRELTKELHNRKEFFSEAVIDDLESGEYLFGRGVMDMKAGLVLHMSILEKASIEEWPINILLLTVPDEEINSNGMRMAVPRLVDMREEHGLNYSLFINGEPVFARDPSENDFKVYSGSIGKILPSALFYGKESHIGEPLSGLPSNYIASYLTQEMSWNPLFSETVFEETAPLPLTVLQRDVKEVYSAQTPYRAVAMYNIFLLERNPAEIMDLLEATAQKALDRMRIDYLEMCNRQGIQPVNEVKIHRFEELQKYAVDKLGEDAVEKMIEKVLAEPDLDLREQSHAITDALLYQCQELTPAVVLMYTPPYYPPVNSSDSSIVQGCIDSLTKKAKQDFGFDVKQNHFFNGVSDLSYVNFQDHDEGWVTYQRNTPVYGRSYDIPFQSMQQLKAPVINVGPFGRDAHQRTERLHVRSAFEEMPILLEHMIHSQFLVK